MGLDGVTVCGRIGTWDTFLAGIVAICFELHLREWERERSGGDFFGHTVDSGNVGRLKNGTLRYDS